MHTAVNEALINVSHIGSSAVEDIRIKLSTDSLLREGLGEAVAGCGGVLHRSPAASYESLEALSSSLGGQAQSRDFYFLLPKASARAIIFRHIKSNSSDDGEVCEREEMEEGGSAKEVPAKSGDALLVDATLALFPWPAVTVNYGPPIGYAADFFTATRHAWSQVGGARGASSSEAQYADVLRFSMLAVRPLIAEIWDACVVDMLSEAVSAKFGAAATKPSAMVSYHSLATSFVHCPSQIDSAVTLRRRFAELPGLLTTVTVCWSEVMEESYTSAVINSMSSTAAWLMGIPTAARPARDSVCISVRVEWLQSS